MSFISFIVNKIKISIFCISLFIHYIKSYYNIFIPFRTKMLRVDYENDDYEFYEGDKEIIGSSSFLNRWFYNGIYFSGQMGSPTHPLAIYFNCDNSYFSIGKCEEKLESNTFTITKDIFTTSKSLKIKEIKDNNNNTIYNLGSDNMNFFDSSNFQSTMYVNEEYNGIDFLYYDNGGNRDILCGNIGLSLNYNDDNNTNFIEQLKKKKIISKYIWTLEYQTLSQGVIVFWSRTSFL